MDNFQEIKSWVLRFQTPFVKEHGAGIFDLAEAFMSKHKLPFDQRVEIYQLIYQK